jgi:CBS domain containing-hemolysin-like protein
MVEDRKPGAKKALELADNFDKTVTTLLIGNNIVNTGLSTVAVGFFAKLVVFGQYYKKPSLSDFSGGFCVPKGHFLHTDNTRPGGYRILNF